MQTIQSELKNEPKQQRKWETPAVTVLTFRDTRFGILTGSDGPQSGFASS